MFFVSQIYLFSGELKNNLEEICTNSLFGAFSGMLNGVCKIFGLVWRQYSYGIPIAQLWCTGSIAMLHSWCTYAVPLVPGCCPFSGTIIRKSLQVALSESVGPFFLFTGWRVYKEMDRQVDEEMGLAGKHESVLLWIRIEVLE